ncbi:MAG: C39 family peptidase [Verrucomicrobiota bacterium]
MKLLLFPLLMSGVCWPLTGHVQGQELAQKVIVRAAVSRETVDLNWLLDNPSLFTATHEDFEKNYPRKTYMWLDKDKTRARFNPDRVSIKMRGETVGETIVSFKDTKISAVMISVINKGDDGYIKEVPYKTAVKLGTTVLSGLAKVKENPRRKDETVSRAEGSVWSTKKAMYMLEYLWVPEEVRDGWRFYAHCEFVRIRILPPQAQLGVQQNMVKTNVSKAALGKRVKRESDKIWLEGVPMVDQGGKGYCAVASFERVMRYYGSQVDMHDLADLANANAFGTSPSGMKDAVHKMAVRSGMRTREPIFMEGKDYDSLMKSYNREAKKGGSGEVTRPSGIFGLYREMDPDVCRKMRVKDGNFTKFGAEIVKSINAGVPVMWAMQLGMFWEEKIEDSYEANRDKESANEDDETPKSKPEDTNPETRPKRPPEQMSGGHMRLIVGYNLKEKKIYYTDSWGPGHEMKSMNLDDAWTVTMALFMIEPN